MTAITGLGVMLALCIFANKVAVAVPSPVGRADALAAAEALCSASSTKSSPQLAKELQDAVSGPVLTCSSVGSRSAFLDAVAEFQPSGYPSDAQVIPSIVVQPTGKPEAYVLDIVDAACLTSCTRAI